MDKESLLKLDERIMKERRRGSELLTTAKHDLEKLGYVVAAVGVKGDRLSIECFPAVSRYYEDGSDSPHINGKAL
jgi:hypothetical protein